MVDARQDFRKFYAWIRRDFFNFLKACGIDTLTWQQFQLVERIREGGGKIAVKSGQGPGKTYMSSLVGLWRSIRSENAKLIVTAPSMNQCKDAWLAQALKHVENPAAHPYLRRIFKFTGTGYGCFGKHQRIWGCMLKTASNPENIRGQHATDMDIIVEEASGCDDEVLAILRGTQSNKGGLFLMIGNPSKREGMFYDAFHSEAGTWWSRSWNAEETPDSEWFDQGRNRDMEEKFGRESDFYRVNVLGEFPQSDPDSIIPEEWLVSCMESVTLEAMLDVEFRGKVRQQIGLDFARFGSDESCVGYVQGNALLTLDNYSHWEPLDVVDRAFMHQARLGWEDRKTVYVPDATGIGQGVLGYFYRHQKRVHEFHAGGKAANPKMFADKVTEAYFNFRELVRTKNVWIPENKILHKQLVTRKYFMTAKRQLILEQKDAYKKRGYESPDRADTAVQALYGNAISEARMA